jgi:hypothetical protein
MCPRCSSKDIADIVYGFIELSEDLDNSIQTGEVELGGCCIGSESPNYKCNSCNNQWL